MSLVLEAAEATQCPPTTQPTLAFKLDKNKIVCNFPVSPAFFSLFKVPFFLVHQHSPGIWQTLQYEEEKLLPELAFHWASSSSCSQNQIARTAGKCLTPMSDQCLSKGPLFSGPYFRLESR